MENPVLQAPYAIIGGSSIFSLQFPAELSHPEVQIIKQDWVIETPYGPGPPLTLWSIQGRRVLSCRMHGWRPGVERGSASQQLFWIFHKAGVQQIIAEGGVGTVHRSLALRDFVLADDYIDCSQRSAVQLGLPYLLVMRDPLCPTLRKVLGQSAEKVLKGSERRIHQQAVYVNTDGRHFESRAEVRAYRQLGGDVLGQSITPEVYLAREIGACYAGIYMIVNEAEGIGVDWNHATLRDIFYSEARTVSTILLEAVMALPPPHSDCHCLSYRKKTLLVDPSTKKTKE